MCLVMVIGAVNERDPRGLLLVLIWLPWLVPVVLLGRFRLSLLGGVLTYRSPLRTRSWRRDQIAEFGVVPVRVAGPGRLPLHAHPGREQVTFHVAAGSRRRPEELQVRLAALMGETLERCAAIGSSGRRVRHPDRLGRAWRAG